MTTLNEVTRTIDTRNISIFTRELDLSIIVPTRNEAGNIEKLLSGIQQALSGKKVEVIFVGTNFDQITRLRSSMRFPRNLKGSTSPHDPSRTSPENWWFGRSL